MKGIVFFIIGFVLSSCAYFKKEPVKSTGIPLVGYSFDSRFENSGVLKMAKEDNIELSYDKGIVDSCLNLTATAQKRVPVEVSFPTLFNVDDYEGFSVVFWIKKQKNDIDGYMIASCYTEDYMNNYKGWKVFSTSTGLWQWEMSDGKNVWKYNPSYPRQRINDDNWHLLSFSYDKSNKEVRHYFDGVNVAVISVEECDSLNQPGGIVFGGDPYSFDKRRDTFNGYIDEFTFWGRVLTASEIANIWDHHTNKNVSSPLLDDSKLVVLTWNIYQGGEYLGKTVGIERIVEIIRSVDGDIICLQETYGGGEKIADQLGFFLYKRSDNISVISRFPISASFNIYKKEHSGGVQIQLDKNRNVMVYPVWLSPQPDISAYVKSGFVSVDSLMLWEQKTRGVEMRFILSEIPRWERGTSTNIIVAGNFNTGSHFDWTEKNKANNNNMVIPFSISKMLDGYGFIDSYRKVHPDEVKFRGNTWSPLFKEVFNSRIDYIYYKGDALKVVSSRTISEHQYGFPSDHALVVSVFEISE
ncbi:MAG: endonuclease/exonuclease/phosphatase family protein [Marinilabiliaceae bacterium]|nr:endonuclease/exonuclease/phosphatase family protein [Marinilabiliaceae bacterium]